MDPVAVALSGIAILFFLFLLIKRIMPRLCAICAAVSVMWVAFLLLWWTGRLQDPVLLALLIGESVVGGFYMLNSLVPKELHVFALPALLTMTLAGYALIRGVHWPAAIVVLAAWALFAIIYVARKKTAHELFERILACCRNW